MEIKETEYMGIYKLNQTVVKSSSSNIILMIKSRSMRWGWHVARMREKRSA
jgi:hypothetical protein